MQSQAAAPALALLLSLAPLTLACCKSGTGAIDAAVPDAFIDSGWDPAPMPYFWVKPNLLDFGTVDVGTTSTAQTVSILVISGPLTLNTTIAGPGFTLAASTCVWPITYGGCTLSVKFSPTTIGGASGVLTIEAVGNLPAVTVALSGAGNSPGPTFPFPEPVDLGTLSVNQEAPAVVQLAPTRPVATLACTSSSPDLTWVSQTCPTTGTIEAPCTFTFTFKAATAGAKKDEVICAGGGITLLRTVVANVVAPEPLTISPTAPVFTATVGGIYVVTFIVANAGGVAAGPLTATLSGSTDFSIVSNGCASPVAPTATCTIQVAFGRTSWGTKTAILTVSESSQPTRSASATLTGGGSSPPTLFITPSSADFGSVVFGQASAPHSFTLKNSGGSISDVLTFNSNDPAFEVDLPSCAPLAPGAACTFAVTFKPTIAGTRQASIYLTDSSSVAVSAVQVTGVCNEAAFDGGTLDSGASDGAGAGL